MSGDGADKSRDERPGGASAPTPPGLEAIVRAARGAGPIGDTTATTTAGPVQGKRGPAPVHLWNPPYCGDIGLEIRIDGSWWYRGSVIGRRALVDLFASVLRKDEDGHTYLVTPAEKVLVNVADAPFLGVELLARGSGPEMQLEVRTNLDDRVLIGPDHPLRFEAEPMTGGIKPYMRVRGRLEARLNREMTRDLLAIALDHQRLDGVGGSIPGVWSGGVFWELTG